MRNRSSLGICRLDGTITESLITMSIGMVTSTYIRRTEAQSEIIVYIEGTCSMVAAGADRNSAVLYEEKPGNLLNMYDAYRPYSKIPHCNHHTSPSLAPLAIYRAVELHNA
jgi:hypothetical protein